ncbi:hypothetical protein [uncultured Ruminococcus sp.]|uniref:hypothetical protein n=1 Tax=uncultured Ruminococcus sp. TaxID=165186 RepID=UPI002629267E|nr:hypothetical protein [uncultured Ruminococcus sp.]
MKKKIGKVLRTARDLILNPHLAICFFIAWIITNGWAYVALGVGTYYEYKWLVAIAATYLAILWSPLCAEGILTFLIAIFLMQKLFPNDERTLKFIKVYYRRYKSKLKKQIHKKKPKKFVISRKAVSAQESTEIRN